MTERYLNKAFCDDNNKASLFNEPADVYYQIKIMRNVTKKPIYFCHLGLGMSTYLTGNLGNHQKPCSTGCVDKNNLMIPSVKRVSVLYQSPILEEHHVD